jgi:hypothetical protein
MESSKKVALRLTSAFGLLMLAACAGGGGGGASTNTPANSTGDTGSTGNTGNTGNNTPPVVSIGAPDKPDVAIASATFDFVSNPPPAGTPFGLFGPAVKVTGTTVEAANKGTDGRLTYRGLASDGVPTFDISIPAINLNATNVRADGTLAPASGGGTALLGIATLKYTAAGVWGYSPGGGISYAGMAATGSGTPIANVPTAGSASYSGTTVGIYFVPSGTGTISTGALSGDIVVTVNFGTGAVSGTLSGMATKPADGGASTAWNDVALSADVKRLTNNASFIGTTSTGGAPAGSGKAGFSSAATGGLGGAFFGPNADEIGGTWALTDPGAAGGGKTAFGAFGASSTGCNGCSNSGGGNGGSGTPPPGVSIAPPGIGLATFGGAGVGTSFISDPPPTGTTISLGGGGAAITPTSVANFTPGQVSGIYRGTVTNGGVSYPVFDLVIQNLPLAATNIRGDGTVAAQADGGQVSANIATMNYALLGSWKYAPAGGNTSYTGPIVAGYGTPVASVPTSGSATYTGTGTVNGTYAVPAGANAIEMGTLTGDVSLTVNFAGNTANGNFTNMKAQAAGSGTVTPWNDVALGGTLTRGTSAQMSGPTSTTTNASPAGFSAAARGSFLGALYGPTAQEAAGAWILSESTPDGGKAAFGTFGAHQ